MEVGTGLRWEKEGKVKRGGLEMGNGVGFTVGDFLLYMYDIGFEKFAAREKFNLGVRFFRLFSSKKEKSYSS